jgi:hypothetical protein
MIDHPVAITTAAMAVADRDRPTSAGHGRP